MNINEIYDNPSLKEEIKECFEERGFIQLQEFLQNDLKHLRKKLISKTTNHIKNTTISTQVLNDDAQYDLEIIKFLEFFKSVEFVNFLEEVTGFSLIPEKTDLRKYSRGDFIAIDDSIEEDYLEVIFDLSEEKNNDSFVSYTTKQEEAFQLEPTYNRLTFLFKPKEVMHYLDPITKDKVLLRIEMKFTLIE